VSPPLKVCFHAPFLWPLWSENGVAFTGGAETQQAMIARGLAAIGMDVTVVSCDYGQPRCVSVNGVRVLRTYRLSSGPPVLRFLHPRLTRTIGALRHADADVHYVRGASIEAGESYEVARASGKAFVFGAAHDHDAMPTMPGLRTLRDRLWYRRALRGARAVVAQTLVQQELFRRHHGIETTLVRNLVEVPERAVEPGAASIVWLGTYKASKRPHWFVELAKALPQFRFEMRGVVPIPPDTTAVWESIRHEAEGLPQLQVSGYLDHAGVTDLYRRAALFVHTSPAEGFPNTLLEAWAVGVPSISCVDPDGLVTRERLGEVVTDVPSLVRAVQGWMSQPERRLETGARARAYVARAHAPAPVVARLAEVFSRAAGR